MKYFYTYRVDCTAVGWEDYYYFGQHKTDNLYDGYKGSGTGILEYYKQYHNDYKFTILEFYTNKTELDIAEQNLIGDLWKTDPYCLNRMPGGAGGSGMLGKKHSEETKRKISESEKAHPERHIIKGMKGKHHSEETKRKISEALRGKNNPSPIKGRKQSEIQIQKRINKIKGRKNPNCATNTGKHRVYREDGTYYYAK